MTTNISSYNLSERQVQLDLSVLPYDFEENVKTLSEQARQAWNDVQDLEASACPDNKAQITITMHPSFASQIYFPEEFCLSWDWTASAYVRFSASRATLQAAILKTEKLPLRSSASERDRTSRPFRQTGKVVSDTLVGKQIRTIESIEAVSIYDRLDIPNDYFEDHFLVGVYVTPGKQSKNPRKTLKITLRKTILKYTPTS